MPEREKVIKGLECCATNRLRRADCEAMDCIYLDLEGHGCIHQLIRDALALLKAQEPRVMTLEEVLGLKFDDVVYLQVYPTNVVLSSIVVDVIPRIPEINTGVVQFRHAAGYNGINNADLDYYGKTWCCWTSRPTDKQREAVPWERLN